MRLVQFSGVHCVIPSLRSLCVFPLKQDARSWMFGDAFQQDGRERISAGIAGGMCFKGLPSTQSLDFLASHPLKCHGYVSKSRLEPRRALAQTSASHEAYCAALYGAGRPQNTTCYICACPGGGRDSRLLQTGPPRSRPSAPPPPAHKVDPSLHPITLQGSLVS